MPLSSVISASIVGWPRESHRRLAWTDKIEEMGCASQLFRIDVRPDYDRNHSDLHMEILSSSMLFHAFCVVVRGADIQQVTFRQPVPASRQAEAGRFGVQALLLPPTI